MSKELQDQRMAHQTFQNSAQNWRWTISPNFSEQNQSVQTIRRRESTTERDTRRQRNSSTNRRSECCFDRRVRSESFRNPSGLPPYRSNCERNLQMPVSRMCKVHVHSQRDAESWDYYPWLVVSDWIAKACAEAKGWRPCRRPIGELIDFLVWVDHLKSL